jgi:hypothetical protein
MAIAPAVQALPLDNVLQILSQAEESPTPSDPAASPAESPASTETTTQSSVDSPRFTCEVYDGQYTVMYYPESQPGQAYAWTTPTELGGGWTEERRCNEISRRLESYRPDGLLELQTGMENGYDIICVTSEQDPSCRIVLTVPPGQDARITRDRVFENLAVADNGQSTAPVTAFSEGEADTLINQIGNLLNLDLNSSGQPSSRGDGINLQPFLDPADGGTGALLNDNFPSQSAPSLNPDRFR